MSENPSAPRSELLARLLMQGAEIPSDPKDNQISELQSKLQELDDERHEERFLWVVTIVVIFDAYAFTQMQNWAGALVIGVFELVGLAIYAAKCRVDAVAPLLDKLTGAIGGLRSRS